jgi:hypothetical protein
MNPKRFVLAILAVFVGVWVTDVLIHGVWLQSTYKATQSLWRSDAEMQAHMGWLLAGQVLFAATFVTLWAKGFANMSCIRCACVYGLVMGSFSQAFTLVMYAVQPLPGALAVKWFAAGLVQGALMGALVFLVYKPKPQEAALKA